jgi:DNA-binding transcriptional LysR family regulator
MSLNLYLLRIFATVAQTHSFSRAAKTLYISQPAVSKGVQALEKQVGMPLIDRSARRFALTEAGEILYQHAARIFALEQEAEAALDQLQGLVTGHLSLGASYTIGNYVLPAMLGRFHGMYPGVRLSLEIGSTNQMVERLSAGPLDMAFVEGPVDAPNLVISPWRTDTLVIIARPDHPLTREETLSAQQVFAQPFILREPGSGTREIIETALRRRGLELHVRMELGTNEAIKQAVQAGPGIAMMSETAVRLERSAGLLTTLDVPDFSLTRPFRRLVVAGKPLSRAAAAFQTLLAEL